MLNAEKHKQTLLSEFYLDPNFQVRRTKDGYLNRFKKDDLAQFHENQGYWSIQIPFTRTQIRKSHLVILLHTGVLLKPKQQVDHIDGNRKNDHPDNLRIVTDYLNSRNRKIRSDNVTGITGICWNNSKQVYVIRKTIGSKRLDRSAKTLEKALIKLEELNSMTTEYTDRHGK